jgi:hypothetical protein
VKNQNSSPDCFKCVHFEITWDEHFPRSCSIFGFKGKELPSFTVLKYTGYNCPSFKNSGKVKEK